MRNERSGRLISGRGHLPSLACAAGAAGGSADRYEMGAQSFSFRKFDFPGAVAQLKALGLPNMEFCGVHFPPDASHAGFESVKAALAKAGVRVPCYGVEGFGADEKANRAKFVFAKALGVKVLTADPAPDSFDILDTLCDEFGVAIAIHNHGPGARYDKVEDTLRAVRGHSPLIGACVDTGHVIRSGEKPEEVIARLGSRVISLHLKDWKVGGEEQVLGEGSLDLAGVAAALESCAFQGPVIMEFENSPDNPVPEMRLGFDNWREAVRKV